MAIIKKKKTSVKNKKAAMPGGATYAQTGKKVLRYLKKYRVLFGISLILAICVVALTLYVPVLVGRAIDLAIGKDNVDFDGIYSILLKIGIVAGITALLQWLMNVCNNRITFGIVFCMLATCNSGSHPGNVWPIMAGYFLASLVGVNPINAQAIMVGLCYASGLCPIAGKYGWWAGILGGIAHYSLVTSVPALHGGFCLYNGGFTSILIAMMLVPQLEMFSKTKEERRLQKAGK